MTRVLRSRQSLYGDNDCDQGYRDVVDLVRRWGLRRSRLQHPPLGKETHLATGDTCVNRSTRERPARVCAAPIMTFDGPSAWSLSAPDLPPSTGRFSSAVQISSATSAIRVEGAEAAGSHSKYALRDNCNRPTSIGPDSKCITSGAKVGRHGRVRIFSSTYAALGPVRTGRQ